MRQFNIKKGIIGSQTMENHMIRFTHMIQHQAKRKAKILTFWYTHGLAATKDAFGTGRSTLFLWQKQLQASHGNVEALNNKSRAPKRTHKRVIPKEVQDFIISQRKAHPRLGKDKLSEMLKDEHIARLSASTVGRMIQDLKQRGLLPTHTKYTLHGGTGNLIARKARNKRKKLRRKGYTPKQAGDLIEIDTIIYFINGIRRYIITAIDLYSDFAFAYAYKSPSSSNAQDFFRKLESVAPYTITRVQTDNGSEFEKHFRAYLKENTITHFHTYPRSPKMNAHVERLNRTIQEEFSDYHKETLAYDIQTFNYALMEYCVWYNTKRPHHTLGLQSPMRYIMSDLTKRESNMLWTSTLP